MTYPESLKHDILNNPRLKGVGYLFVDRRDPSIAFVAKRIQGIFRYDEDSTPRSQIAIEETDHPFNNTRDHKLPDHLRLQKRFHPDSILSTRTLEYSLYETKDIPLFLEWKRAKEKEFDDEQLKKEEEERKTKLSQSRESIMAISRATGQSADPKHFPMNNILEYAGLPTKPKPNNGLYASDPSFGGYTRSSKKSKSRRGKNKKKTRKSRR
jgi:hypothetical protein